MNDRDTERDALLRQMTELGRQAAELGIVLEARERFDTAAREREYDF